MNKKLIPGGIYTFTEEPDVYYIFIKEDILGDEFLFFRIKFESLFDGAQIIHEHLNRMCILSNLEFIRLNTYLVPKKYFHEECDGFLGTVKQRAVDVLSNVQ